MSGRWSLHRPPAPDPEMESNARLNLGDTLTALGRLEEAGDQFAWVQWVVLEHSPKGAEGSRVLAPMQ